MHTQHAVPLTALVHDSSATVPYVLTPAPCRMLDQKSAEADRIKERMLRAEGCVWMFTEQLQQQAAPSVAGLAAAATPACWFDSMGPCQLQRQHNTQQQMQPGGSCRPVPGCCLSPSCRTAATQLKELTTLKLGMVSSCRAKTWTMLCPCLCTVL